MKKLFAVFVVMLMLISISAIVFPVKATSNATIEFKQPTYAYKDNTRKIEVKVTNTGTETLNNLWLGVDLIHKTTIDNEADKTRYSSEGPWVTLYSFTLDEIIDSISVQIMVKFYGGPWDADGQATLRVYWTPTGDSEVQKGSDVIVTQSETSYVVKTLLTDEILGASGTLRVATTVETSDPYQRMTEVFADWCVVTARRIVEATRTPIIPDGAVNHGGIDFGVQQGLVLISGAERIFTTSYTFSRSKAYGYDYDFGAYYWDMAVWRNGYPGQGGETIVVRAQEPFTIPCTFDMTVSIEWNISPTDTSEKGPSFVNEVVSGLKKASNFLFDATDGQMCFRQVSIYDNGEHWHEATLRIHEEIVGNNWWDHAWPKASDTDFDWAWPPATTAIGMGRKWIHSDQGTQYASFDASFAYQTVVHEFGHLELGLQDEYMSNPLLYSLNDILQIMLKQRPGDASCPCIMYHQDMYYELCTPVNHDTGTWQENTNHKSCWSTIKEKYSWIYIPMKTNELWNSDGPYDDVGKDMLFNLGGRSGGPDYFGYTYFDSNSLIGPVYDWIETSGTGTMILPSSDDQWVGNINLGFFFNYYGTDYSQLAIGNNGLLFSGAGTWQYINQPITQTPSIHGLIAPHWDDLVTWGSAGAIYYQTLGTAPNRKFVVEWYNNQHYYSSSSGVTFEVILYEGTNNILFQYKDLSFGSVYRPISSDRPPYDNGGSATVGIEDPSGSIGLQYSYNEQAISPGLAILFRFPAFAGTNMYLSMNAPTSMDRGSPMTYSLYYNNFGDHEASNVELHTTLPSTVNFVYASDSGTYDVSSRRVTWNIGTVMAFPSGRGSRTVAVTIPTSLSVGTVIPNTALISTSTLETRYDDNTASVQTIVTGSNLPPNVGISPTLGNTGGVPSVYWRTPITFSYYDATATGVDIRIHFDSGGSDIIGSMTGGPPAWTYTETFYPRYGRVTVTYTVNNPTPYSAGFDLRNMRGFENTITATEIENYIQSVTPDSPMLTEAGIGQRFIDTGLSNNVNPAFLVATAQHEGVFGTEGWAAAHPVAHNTMGWGIYPGHMEEDWEGLDRNAFASWGDCIAHVAWRISASDSPYYGAGHYTVSEIRTIYAGEPAIQTIVNYMNDLATSAGQAGTFDEDFSIYIDPAGYIFDVDTGARISGATVWLQYPDGLGGWANVPMGQSPPTMQPDVNPQVTGEAGQYQWDVLEGSYRVHVEAPGYYLADSIVVTIPPPVTDLHIGLTPLPDGIPPTTTLTIGNPIYVDSGGNTYVTSSTPFTLLAEDNVGGTGVASTRYKFFNSTYNSGWIVYSPLTEFHLSNLADGIYSLSYNSADIAGNIESINTESICLDNTCPLIDVSNPPAGWALQDGVTFIGSIKDVGCGVHSMSFAIREANGGEGVPIGFENLPVLYTPSTGDWSFSFNTLLVPDGYYVLYIEAEDNLGNEDSTTVPYSVRNWAVLELLPASENNKAGRTMPIKFSLRVAAVVDPLQPFVYNEELIIDIYVTDQPSDILQESTFGDTARDYRINSFAELYITNFKTLKTPKEYCVEIYRKDMLIDSFTFETNK